MTKCWKIAESTVYVGKGFGSQHALPTEHEVHIKEIREGPANDIRLSVSTRAGTVGLFVSPQVGPFLVAATIANVRMDEIMDVHTIRIMCKAAPQTGQPGNGELPAKQ